ncbi:MAG: 4-hydroxyphenylacetate 3-hydroxylase N-terminal domain-containing protein, partial [Thermodesulfobacteriota bacterium]|nr:4-hydroxyphenylacetate 3-hydroxylase N-terminal domain-containing protein [Thermodesulfobacteriota bacterium]
MALKTGNEYLNSLKSLNLEAHVLGQKTKDLTGHPLITPSLRAAATTYDCAHQKDTQPLFRVFSPLAGQEVNRFTHLHQSPNDLIDKVLMQRRCGNITACCFQRCVGLDAANALFSVTFECDQEHGTDYHERFCEYWRHVQREDLMVDGAMTDAKGDRGKRPQDQADPDMYVRAVDRKNGGLVVRGAKLHQTGMLNSHEMIVMPTINMRPGEEDWAVCFAVPTGTKGIRYIYGRQS